jgi:hypothetical protein
VQGLEIAGIDLLKRNAGEVSKKAVVAKGRKKSAAKSSAKVLRKPHRRG